MPTVRRQGIAHALQLALLAQGTVRPKKTKGGVFTQIKQVGGAERPTNLTDDHSG